MKSFYANSISILILLFLFGPVQAEVPQLSSSSSESTSALPDQNSSVTTLAPVIPKKSNVIKFDVIDSNFESTEKIVIDAETIQKSRSTNVAQVLANQANITIATTNIQPNSIFVRGGDSSHVLILIDDVPSYDSSTLQKTLNLSNVNISNVKRIEVLKGSQAVLYGGQAMSAVIKIYTIPTQFRSSAKISSQLKRQMGSDTTASLAKAFNDDVLMSLDARYADQKNASPVLNSQKTEGYPQKIGSVEAVVSHKSSPNFRSALKLNYSTDDNQIPDSGPGFAPVDAEEMTANTETAGGVVTVNSNDRLVFSLSNQKITREYYEGSPGSDSKYEGQLLNARLDFKEKLTEPVTVLVGLSYNQELVARYQGVNKIANDVRQQNEGYFGKVTFAPINGESENLLIETGIRNENSQGKDPQITGQLGLTVFENLKFEVATGSRKPSLSQRFDPQYGNPDLEDEKALTYNASYAHRLNEESNIAFAVFDSNYKNLVGSVCTGATRGSCRTVNVRASRTMGAELSANTYNEQRGFGLKGYIAYQEPKDLSTGAWLSRRPLRNAGIQIKKDWSDKFDSLLEVAHTGSRLDSNGRSAITLTDYTVLNVTANYRVQEDLDIFGRVENLQNKTYETTFGYYVQGAELKAGIEKRF